MNPLWRILQFCVGDLLAKTLSFLAFIFLARILDVANYGTLEFALSILAYFLLLGDGGLELCWSRVRESNSGRVRCGSQCARPSESPRPANRCGRFVPQGLSASSVGDSSAASDQ